MRAGRRSAPLDASTMLAAALVREDGERGSILTRTGNGKLPSSDLGNRNWITGTVCANLDDLAGDGGRHGPAPSRYPDRGTSRFALTAWASYPR
jgi:hypothetical protein